MVTLQGCVHRNKNKSYKTLCHPRFHSGSPSFSFNMNGRLIYRVHYYPLFRQLMLIANRFLPSLPLSLLLLQTTRTSIGICWGLTVERKPLKPPKATRLMVTVRFYGFVFSFLVRTLKHSADINLTLFQGWLREEANKLFLDIATQDDVNPVFRLVTRAGKKKLSCPLWIFLAIKIATLNPLIYSITLQILHSYSRGGDNLSIHQGN